MGFRIKSNVVALEAQHHLKHASREQAKEFSKLATGKRITKAADDAAGLAIATRLRSHTKGLKQAQRNASDGISLVQVAEGGLNEASTLLTRMREITIQAASDTVGEKEREYLDIEFQQLSEEIERIAQSTSFNGIHLIKGENEIGTMDFQIGNFKGEEYKLSWDSADTNATLTGLGVEGLDVTEKGNARDAIEDIDNAIDTLSGYRANLGAVQSRLQSTITNLDTQVINQEAARSTIEDADIAESVSKLASATMAKEASASILSQANQIPQSALRLL